MECVICDRFAHNRPHEGSVGGYLYEDEHWVVYHAPIQTATLGQLFLVAKRHYLDFAEMSAAEAETYGRVLRRLYAPVKTVTGAERVYALVTLEGVPHFHVWLIPRRAAETVRGWAFLTAERLCAADAAAGVVRQLRQALTQDDERYQEGDAGQPA